MDRSRRVRTTQPPEEEKEEEESSACRRDRAALNDDALGPDDFRDVFGGPPRTILFRYFSNVYPRSHSVGLLYDEVFRPPENAAPGAPRDGRSLPEFKIPSHERSHAKREINRFYDDIFGWEGEGECECETFVRSRSRSKEKSEAILTPDDVSPPRPTLRYDDNVFRFASKLRPINVKSRRNGEAEDAKRQDSPLLFAGKRPIAGEEKEFPEHLRNFPFGLFRKNESLETISLEPTSNRSVRVSPDDFDANYPSSGVSSVYHSAEKEVRAAAHVMADKIMEEAEYQDNEDDDFSFVIEINSDHREGACESNAVDEAIAWAKEKFQIPSPKLEKPPKVLKDYQVSEAHSDSLGSWEEQGDKSAVEEEPKEFTTLGQREIRVLDQKISRWSDGKETDIRLLLCTLHHILWPNSGWLPTSLANIIEISKVKKAFQRARLCLHPDKLQQRGATLPQKYLAEKAFKILQDAWSVFNHRGIA